MRVYIDDLVYQVLDIFYTTNYKKLKFVKFVQFV